MRRLAVSGTHGPGTGRGGDLTAEAQRRGESPLMVLFILDVRHKAHTSQQGVMVSIAPKEFMRHRHTRETSAPLRLCGTIALKDYATNFSVPFVCFVVST